MNFPPCATGHPARRLRTAIALSAAVALSAGCSIFADRSGPPPPKAEIRAMAFRAVTVSDADSGAPIALAASQPLSVRLATTVVGGLEWSLVEQQPAGVLAVVPAPGGAASVFERALRGTDIDAAGDVVWRFRPLAAGTTSLRFELRRPRTLDPAERVVTYIVTVRPAEPGATGQR